MNITYNVRSNLDKNLCEIDLGVIINNKIFNIIKLIEFSDFEEV